MLRFVLLLLPFSIPSIRCSCFVQTSWKTIRPALQFVNPCPTIDACESYCLAMSECSAYSFANTKCILLGADTGKPQICAPGTAISWIRTAACDDTTTSTTNTSTTLAITTTTISTSTTTKTTTTTTKDPTSSTTTTPSTSTSTTRIPSATSTTATTTPSITTTTKTTTTTTFFLFAGMATTPSTSTTATATPATASTTTTTTTPTTTTKATTTTTAVPCGNLTMSVSTPPCSGYIESERSGDSRSCPTNYQLYVENMGYTETLNCNQPRKWIDFFNGVETVVADMTGG